MIARAWYAALAAVFIAALAVRLVALDERPMHTDEAVHGVGLGRLLEGHGYRYDPVDYHGPTLYYLTLPWAWLRGERTAEALTEFTLRAVPAFLGASLILLLVPWRKVIGGWGVLWAALFIACSPIQLYYHRVYIHETLLVFLGFALLNCLLSWFTKPRLWIALTAGLLAGLMHATKATSALMFAAMAGAWILCWLWVRLRGTERTPLAELPPLNVSLRHAGWAALVALAVSALLHSAFFTHPAGIMDSITAYFISPDRAAGQGHEKPWYTHLHWVGGYRSGGFLWTEAFLLGLGVFGLFFSNAWKKRSPGLPTLGTPLLGWYAILLMVIYALIPYKTPWLMLGPMLIMTVLAGSGAAAMVRLAHWTWARIGVVAVLLLGTAQLGAQARRAAFRFAADERVPYVYSHTSPDAVRLAARIVKSMDWLPETERVVQVAAEEYWPLPWYLRSLDRVGYWNERPPRLVAPVIVLSRPISAEARAELEATHRSTFAGLRPGVLVVVWFREDLWERIINPKKEEE